MWDDVPDGNRYNLRLIADASGILTLTVLDGDCADRSTVLSVTETYDSLGSKTTQLVNTYTGVGSGWDVSVVLSDLYGIDPPTKTVSVCY